MSQIIIAQRRFSERGSGDSVVVSMTKPRKARGLPAFEVLILITGYGFTEKRKIFGVDEFQALDLGLKTIGRELEDKRYSGLRWHFGSHAKDLGFARSDDQKLSAHLAKNIEIAVRKHRQQSAGIEAVLRRRKKK